MKNILFLLLPFSAFAQDTILLPIDSMLFESLETYHQSLLTAQLSEFEITSKGNWMNYVPNVGIGYTPQGKPRPTTSFSLTQIFTAQRNREAIEAKRRAIQQTASLFLESEKQELYALLRQIKILQSDVQFAESVFQIDEQLFRFYEIQHQNNELTASQFLLKKRDFLIKKQEINKLINTVEEKKIEILTKCKISVM